jgi:hypothetical protein
MSCQSQSDGEKTQPAPGKQTPSSPPRTEGPVGNPVGNPKNSKHSGVNFDLNDCTEDMIDMDAMKKIQICSQENNIDLFDNDNMENLFMLVDLCNIEATQILDLICYRRLR